MKGNIKKLLANLISLQASLLLAGMLLSFSATKANEKQQNNYPVIALSPVKPELTQNTPSLFFRIWKGHKATCQRICSGKVKSLSACLASIYHSCIQYTYLAACNILSPLSWVRPGYYIFLFIYTLF